MKFKEAVTYDDMLIVPQYSDIASRKEVDIGNSLGHRKFNIPKALILIIMYCNLPYKSQMAEKEGFEPPVPFQVQLISSQSHSATLPLLQKSWQESRPGELWQASTIGQYLTILLKIVQ